MFKSKIKFLGLCILLSSVILSASMIYCFGFNTNKQQNRYYISTDNTGTVRVIDSYTGKVYADSVVTDYVNRTREQNAIKYSN